MQDQWLSWNDTVDPAACNSNPTIYERFSRDPERTPFQWNDQKNAGFSSAEKTWLPVANNYKQINVQTESIGERSHLKVYNSLQVLRRENTMKNGDFRYAALGKHVVSIARYVIFEKKVEKKI